MEVDITIKGVTERLTVVARGLRQGKDITLTLEIPVCELESRKQFWESLLILQGMIIRQRKWDGVDVTTGEGRLAMDLMGIPILSGVFIPVSYTFLRKEERAVLVGSLEEA